MIITIIGISKERINRNVAKLTTASAALNITVDHIVAVYACQLVR